MNTFQSIKLADAVGQLLITPVLYLVTSEPVYAFTEDYRLIACYLFGVGAWQATSCLLWGIEAAVTRKYIAGSRKNYSWVLLVLSVWALMGWVGVLITDAAEQEGDVLGGLLMFAGAILVVALTFIGPIMSIWYFRLTLAETRLFASRSKMQ